MFIHAEQELPRRRLDVSVHVVSQDGSRLNQQRERSRRQTHHLKETREFTFIFRNTLFPRIIQLKMDARASTTHITFYIQTEGSDFQHKILPDSGYT